MSEEASKKRRLAYAPFALLVLWAFLGFTIWRDGWTSMNQGFAAIIALWSAFRLFTYFRSRQ